MGVAGSGSISIAVVGRLPMPRASSRESYKDVLFSEVADNAVPGDYGMGMTQNIGGSSQGIRHSGWQSKAVVGVGYCLQARTSATTFGLLYLTVG